MSEGLVLKEYIREIPFQSAEYPKELKALANAPETLYGVGNISLLKTRKFTVVGSRRTTAAALKLGSEVAKELSQNFTLVTGIADGGDSAVIEGALQGSGRVICVLAGGFSSLPQGNFPLVRKVAERGLLLSPHPYDTPARSFSYEYRNTLLAALGEGTLVLGAGEKSGALITAKHAEKLGKKIFAFPYPPRSFAGVGCNALIKKGAHLTESAGDILEKFGVSVEESALKTPTLSADEEKLFSVLREMGEGHITELSARSGIPTFKAMAVLSALCVKGVAVALGGNRFSAV